MRSYEVEEGVWVAGETKLRVAGETGTVIRTSENSMLLAISIFEINECIRDSPRTETVPHFVTFFHIYRCICQKLLFYWTYCHILYMICYPHTLVHLLRPHRCPYLNYGAL